MSGVVDVQKILLDAVPAPVKSWLLELDLDLVQYMVGYKDVEPRQRQFGYYTPDHLPAASHVVPWLLKLWMNMAIIRTCSVSAILSSNYMYYILHTTHVEQHNKQGVNGKTLRSKITEP